ncbi:MAG: sugar phosphate isomerase/epimerase, partial [Endomicrobia bacterium]|nr:sugar phosphate isomerase/epimerase [Endomicrobiia bacterium]
MKKTEFLKSGVSSFVRWFLELNSVKLTAIIVVNCFLLTGVYGQAVAAAAEKIRTTQQFKQMFEDFTLPYSYGNIVDANYTGSDTVVITIQDLHSHPEVQKNISGIIKTFDDEYKIKNVYMEGAYGQVDTSWLKAVSDKDLRGKILDSMIESGRLTGAEYYSALSGRTNLIKGLEKKDEYLSNLKRFGEILNYQNDSDPLIKSMGEDAERIKRIYFNKRQLKISELSKEYERGDIDAKKYFAKLKSDTDKLGIDIYKYENIRTYVRLLEDGSKIKYDRATRELHEFVGKLEGRLPYSLYQMLLDSTDNFTNLDKLYVYLIKLAKESDLDLSANFPELNKFFGYLELSRKVNSLEMMKEEQRLSDEINEGFGTNASEREAAFVAGFIRYLDDYYSSKITSDDYAYYKANIGKFKKLWLKYIDNKKLTLLEPYEKTADKFYDINTERNGYFISNIDGLDAAGKEADTGAADNNAVEKTIKSLRSAKNVYVVVAGGFHRQGISDLLAKKGISYIVITPNATSGLSSAQETYYNIVKEQSKILFQALAALNSTQAGDAEQILMYVKALIEINNPKSASDWPQLQEQINEILKGDSQYKGLGVNITGNKAGDASFEFSAESGKRFAIGYNAGTKETFITQQTQQGPRRALEEKARPAAAARILSGISAIGTIILTGAAIAGLPVIPLISRLAGGWQLSAEEFKRQTELTKASREMTEDNSDMLEKIKSALPEYREELFGRRIEGFKYLNNYILLNKLFFKDSSGTVSNRRLLKAFVRYELQNMGPDSPLNLGRALSAFAGRNGYQSQRERDGKPRFDSSIDDILDSINFLSANNIDYHEVVLQGIFPSAIDEKYKNRKPGNDFWLENILGDYPQFDLDKMLADLKSDFRSRAGEIKRLAKAKGITLTAHLQGQSPSGESQWPKYDADGNALDGMTKILDAQLEIAAMLGMKSVVLHLNGNSREAIDGYIKFAEKAANMAITVNFENEIIYDDESGYNYNSALADRGFAKYETFIQALGKIRDGLSERGKEHIGVVLDVGKALQSFTDNPATDSRGNISDKEFKRQAQRLNLANLKKYYEAVRNAGFSINEIHLAKPSALLSDARNETGKDKTERKVLYKKTRIDESNNPNLNILDFLSFLNERPENNETRFKGILLQETNGFVAPFSEGKEADENAGGRYGSEYNTRRIFMRHLFDLYDGGKPEIYKSAERLVAAVTFAREWYFTSGKDLEYYGISHATITNSISDFDINSVYSFAQSLRQEYRESLNSPRVNEFGSEESKRSRELKKISEEAGKTAEALKEIWNRAVEINAAAEALRAAVNGGKKASIAFVSADSLSVSAAADILLQQFLRDNGRNNVSVLSAVINKGFDGNAPPQDLQAVLQGQADADILDSFKSGSIIKILEGRPDYIVTVDEADRKKIKKLAEDNGIELPEIILFGELSPEIETNGEVNLRAYRGAINAESAVGILNGIFSDNFTATPSNPAALELPVLRYLNKFLSSFGLSEKQRATVTAVFELAFTALAAFSPSFENTFIKWHGKNQTEDQIAKRQEGMSSIRNAMLSAWNAATQKATSRFAAIKAVQRLTFAIAGAINANIKAHVEYNLNNPDAKLDLGDNSSAGLEGIDDVDGEYSRDAYDETGT